MKEKISELIERYLNKIDIKDVYYTIEHPKEEKFGDYSTNIAMVLASKLKKPPRNIAEEFIKTIENNQLFEKIEIAGAGFINFFINPKELLSQLMEINSKKDEYFKPFTDNSKKIQVEFVSANPTGPLHVGHGRGAAIGDSIARILRFAGNNVETEYYINDAGLQMELLGKSVYARYKQLLGYDDELPEDGYKGEYIIDIAKSLVVAYGDRLIDNQDAVEICKNEAAKVILKEIMDDLSHFRVKFDKIFNEKSLYDKGEMDESINFLEQKGVIYNKDGAVWFASSRFGDDKDRVIKRSNGAFTYFASDIAYHRNKFILRGFDEVIDVWGADHHGYVARVKAALKAMDIDPDRLKVVLVQIVNLLRNKEKVSMSTRKGEFIKLKDVMDEVGVDAARFMFVSRSVDSHLDFDLELAKKQSSDNPVYYVQYAHARICSILANIDSIPKCNYPDALEQKEEFDLIKSLIFFKEFIKKATEEIEPYFIVKGLITIAEKFHRFYNKHRIIGSEDNIFASRLILIEAVRVALKLGMDLIGVEAKEKM
ncbi:arginine--tRNA ligase [Hippea jasoniae]|uniref:arginine--tRNA ligase n=1 Tax=Hippea jasoniae TaxID=944479 RepID=UPI000552D486|nr:arginine--tRNA ligase [Hippea jasoniae]